MLQCVHEENAPRASAPIWSADPDARGTAPGYDLAMCAWGEAPEPVEMEGQGEGATSPRPSRLSTDESTRQLSSPVSVEEDGAESVFLREPIAGEDLRPGAWVGRYSVVGRLGEGGMGLVYEARDSQLDRSVALKVLRTNRAGNRSAGTQLLAEAQTLAKIEHPNIVTVYDAGVSGDQVFIAMELCRGQNLREWLVKSEHGIREIIDVFVAAGRGLAAAHAAGVVHRDFKPANVLIGRDGSIKVADFGMARLLKLAVDDTAEHARTTLDPERSVSTIVGTPAYMAPEQLLGRLGDHRMDQFSFCLCLYWALLRHPPFPGRSFHERRRVVPLGLGKAERERLHRARNLPVRVRRALLRGLSVDPEERFESMEALLSELVERRRWSWALTGLALGVGLGLGALVMAEARPEPCGNAEQALGHAWGPERQQTLTEAFLHTGHPNARAQAQRVAASFDRYAARWQQAHEAACQATYVTRAQSQTAFDLRMQCLERRRSRLELAVQTVMHADDARVLDARMSVPFLLPSIEECEGHQALQSAALVLGSGAERQQVDAVLRRIDLANTLREAGELAQGLEVAQQAVVEARALGRPSVLGQALECLGRLQADGAAPQAAAAALREAIEVASRGDDDLMVGRAWPSLVYAMLMGGEVVAAKSLGFPAELAVDRAGDEQARGWLYNNLGLVYSELRDHDQAERYLRRALRIKGQLRGEQDFDVGITWSNLGFALDEAQRWTDASEAFDRADEIFEQTVGPTHLMSHIVRTGRCRVALGRQRYEQARVQCSEALAKLLESSASPVLVSRLERHTADALFGLGRPAEAMALIERARARMVKINPQMVADIDAWLTTARWVPTVGAKADAPAAGPG